MEDGVAVEQVRLLDPAITESPVTNCISNMKLSEPVVGILLAGGKSSRMGGGDKCLLPLAGDRKSVV